VPILAFSLIAIAGLRAEGIDNDYHQYIKNFKENVYSISNYVPFVSSEITSYFIPYFWYLLTPTFFIQLTFLTYAFLGVGFKIWALRNYEYFLLAIVIYVGNLYFLQEFTTIRAGAASGILLLSIQDIIKKNNRGFFLKVFCACLFHYSSLIFVAIWFVQKFRISYSVLFLILAASFLVPVLNLNFVQILYLDRLFPKAAVYLEIMKSQQQSLNLFNFRILISCFMLLFFWSFRKRIDYPGFNVLLNLQFLSLIFFYLFSTTGLAFSLRLFEMFSIVQLILYPLIVQVFPTRLRFYGHIVVLGIATLNFFYNVYLSGIIRNYSSWLFPTTITL